MLVTGVDIIEIERIERVAGKYGDRFLQRIYTQSERESVSYTHLTLPTKA